MKVLVVHNRYQADKPSGENLIVDAEIDLLRAAGVEVLAQLESSDSLKALPKRRMLQVGFGPLYAPAGVTRFRDLLEVGRPDVVHVHNVFPLISPWVIRSANAHGIPVVHTAHNYRHSCVNGMHFREGRTCVECVGKAVPIPAMRHGCYRGSRVQTVPMAAGRMLHRGTWPLVSRFFALTPFMAEWLTRGGVPPEKITLRPTWVPDVGPTCAPGRDLLFVGRLDEAKGIRLLLDAWQLAGPPEGRMLRIAGDGPLSAEVRAIAQQHPSVKVEGRLSPAKVAALMDDAGVLVVPSLWFEGYPLVIAEAFARGRAVLTVRGGSAGTIVDPSVGWITDPSPQAVAASMAAMTEASLAERGRAARLRYEKENSPDAATASLLAVYDEVCRQRNNPDRRLAEVTTRTRTS